MDRRAIDKLLTSIGFVLSIFFFAAAGLLQWGHTFAANTVTTQLQAQNIFFPEAGSPGFTAEEFPDLQQWGGQQVTTGVDYSCFAGGGAFLSTPSDLVRFGLATMSGTLLKRDTVTKLQTRQTLRNGQNTQYGLGWMLEDIQLNKTAEPELLASHASRTIERGGLRIEYDA